MFFTAFPFPIDTLPWGSPRAGQSSPDESIGLPRMRKRKVHALGSGIKVFSNPNHTAPFGVLSDLTYVRVGTATEMNYLPGVTLRREVTPRSGRSGWGTTVVGPDLFWVNMSNVCASVFPLAGLRKGLSEYICSLVTSVAVGYTEVSSCHCFMQPGQVHLVSPAHVP